MFGEYLCYHVYSWIFWRIFSFYLMSHSWLLSPWNQSSTNSSRRECAVLEGGGQRAPRQSLPGPQHWGQLTMPFPVCPSKCTPFPHFLVYTISSRLQTCLPPFLCLSSSAHTPHPWKSSTKKKKKIIQEEKKSYMQRTLIQPRFWTKTLLRQFKVNNHS